MNVRYFAGRALQLFGLLLLPSTIWMVQFERNEWGSITILAVSVAIFWIGRQMLPKR